MHDWAPLEGHLASNTPATCGFYLLTKRYDWREERERERKRRAGDERANSGCQQKGTNFMRWYIFIALLISSLKDNNAGTRRQEEQERKKRGFELTSTQITCERPLSHLKKEKERVPGSVSRSRWWRGGEGNLLTSYPLLMNRVDEAKARETIQPDFSLPLSLSLFTDHFPNCSRFVECVQQSSHWYTCHKRAF